MAPHRIFQTDKSPSEDLNALKRLIIFSRMWSHRSVLVRSRKRITYWKRFVVMALVWWIKLSINTQKTHQNAKGTVSACNKRTSNITWAKALNPKTFRSRAYKGLQRLRKGRWAQRKGTRAHWVEPRAMENTLQGVRLNCNQGIGNTCLAWFQNWYGLVTTVFLHFSYHFEWECLQQLFNAHFTILFWELGDLEKWSL